MFIRSLIRIFEINLQDTFARYEKYSSKLDISRSLIRIFATLKKMICKSTHPYNCSDTNLQRA